MSEPEEDEVQVLADDGAPCPRCECGCEYLDGGLWCCDWCSGVWTARQIAEGPQVLADELE